MKPPHKRQRLCDGYAEVFFASSFWEEQRRKCHDRGGDGGDLTPETEDAWKDVLQTMHQQ